jgi:hypothetical protein
VDDGVSVELVHGRHDAILEFLFGCDTNVAQDGAGHRALREEIEHAELVGDPRVLELELGIEIDHAVVPVEFLAIDHDADGRREKRLGGRADLEHTVRASTRAPAALLRTRKPLA